RAEAQLAAAGDRLQDDAGAPSHPSPAVAAVVGLLVVPAVEEADRAGHRADARLEVAPREEGEELLARAPEVHRGLAGAGVIADVPGVAQRRQFREVVFAVDVVRV